MLTDRLTTFCDGTALSGSAAGSSYLLGSIIDINAARDIGHGHGVYLVITAKTAFVGDGSVVFSLRTHATTVAVSSPVIVASPSYDDAVVAGQVLMVVKLPQEGTAYARYLQMTEAITTNTVDATVNIHLTDEPPKLHHYPEGPN